LSIFEELGIKIKSGVYSNGLIQVISKTKSVDISKEIKGLNGYDVNILLSNSFGHLIYLDIEDDYIYYFNAFKDELEFICEKEDLVWLVNDFLANKDILKNVLLIDKSKKILEKINKLNYCEIFYLEPFEMLGGNEELSNYNKGDIAVTYNLLKQLK
jgi:hypothetical protein